MTRLSEDHDWAIKIYHERADAWFEKSDVVMKESLKCSQPVKANNMHKYGVVTFHNSVTKLPCTSTDYERWYRNFATRIHDLQPILVQECGIETWEYAVKFYDTMYETVQSGNMGGAIVYAVKRG